MDRALLEIVVSQDDAGARLDQFLAGELSCSRSRVKALFQRGLVTAQDSKRLKPSRIVAAGECYRVDLPEPAPCTIEPQPVPFDLIYQDPHILVIQKPAGVVVHPGAGHRDGTLVNGLVERYPDIGSIGDRIRPGIVHRLDQGTSGLMVIARSDRAMAELQRAFQSRSLVKEYIALAQGSCPDTSGLLQGAIGRDPQNRLKMCLRPDGREAQTGYQVLWSRGRYHLMRCRLYTGRTHQIRVHMKALGCPLDGDRLYGPKDPDQHILQDRVFLHSWRLALDHPITGQAMDFLSPLPPELIEALKGPLSIPRDGPPRSGGAGR